MSLQQDVLLKTKREPSMGRTDRKTLSNIKLFLWWGQSRKFVNSVRCLCASCRGSCSSEIGPESSSELVLPMEN